MNKAEMFHRLEPRPTTYTVRPAAEVADATPQMHETRFGHGLNLDTAKIVSPTTDSTITFDAAVFGSPAVIEPPIDPALRRLELSEQAIIARFEKVLMEAVPHQPEARKTVATRLSRIALGFIESPNRPLATILVGGIRDGKLELAQAVAASFHGAEGYKRSYYIGDNPVNLTELRQKLYEGNIPTNLQHHVEVTPEVESDFLKTKRDETLESTSNNTYSLRAKLKRSTTNTLMEKLHGTSTLENKPSEIPVPVEETSNNGLELTEAASDEASKPQLITVVVVDGLEAMSPQTQELLNAAIQTGRYDPDDGNEALDFTRTVFVITTNVGITDMTRANIGFTGTRTREDLAAATKKQIHSTLMSTFLNAVSDEVYLLPVEPEHVTETYDSVSVAVEQQLSEIFPFTVEIAPELKEHIIRKAHTGHDYNLDSIARSLVDLYVQVAQMGKQVLGNTVVVDYDNKQKQPAFYLKPSITAVA